MIRDILQIRILFLSLARETLAYLLWVSISSRGPPWDREIREREWESLSRAKDKRARADSGAGKFKKKKWKSPQVPEREKAYKIGGRSLHKHFCGVCAHIGIPYICIYPRSIVTGMCVYVYIYKANVIHTIFAVDEALTFTRRGGINHTIKCVWGQRYLAPVCINFYCRVSILCCLREDWEEKS